MIARRRLLQAGGAALMLSGCDSGTANSQPPVVDNHPLVPLRQAAPFPVGACVTTEELADPNFAALLTGQFSQITPEWQMKMERVLADDGTLRFDAADVIADFARANGLRLHATTLTWYSQDPPAFERIANDPQAFDAALHRYILAVAGRYQDVASGWDVVNEMVAEDGHGYRGGVWMQALGTDFARRSFDYAREADPSALLFLNDYNLESITAKLDTYQRLLESLLQAGAPVTGIGTQTHLSIDTPPEQAGSAIRALARFGLPIHVSELDVSTRSEHGFNPGPARAAQIQARIVGEVVETFMALPPAQRYAITTWGVRDGDSWLAKKDPGDRPLLFDDNGRPKPAARAFVSAVSSSAS